MNAVTITNHLLIDFNRLHLDIAPASDYRMMMMMMMVVVVVVVPGVWYGADR